MQISICSAPSAGRSCKCQNAIAPHLQLLLHVNAGGTRFIGVYLARQLVEAGHEVTLYTRGKKPVTYKIADDTEDGYYRFSRSVKHIAGDRQVGVTEL